VELQSGKIGGKLEIVREVVIAMEQLSEETTTRSKDERGIALISWLWFVLAILSLVELLT